MFGGTEGLRRAMSQDTVKPTDLRKTLGRLLSYFKPYWVQLLVVGMLVIVATWAQVTAPILIGQTVDCYLTPSAPEALVEVPGVPAAMSNAATNCRFEESTAALTVEQRLAGLGRLVLLILGLYVLTSVVTGLQFYLMTWAGQHVLRRLRVELFQHLHGLPMSYYTENEAGDLMSRITNDMETVQQALNFALIQVLGGFLLIFWVGYSMLDLSIPYALISLSIVPLMALVTVWLSAQARRAYRTTRLEMGSVNAELQENIAAVREVQAFSREDENIQNFMATNAANRDANVRAVAYASALSPALEALGFLALAIVAVVGGLALLRDQTLFGTVISLGLVITFLNYVQRFNQPIRQIAVLWTNIQNAIAGTERIFQLLDEVPAIQDMPNARPMPEIVGRVSFDEVYAAYKKDQSVLKGISFGTEPGQTIAIVGPTGAGKTTIINLIPRFYDVSSGVVRIDGIDVRDVTRESLRSQIGIVLQDTFLFSTTVMENIRFGWPGASDEEVFAAARLAHVDGFVERLPEGYETVLGERGSGLSQGQRQLIAIARAALADPRILILDEATSSVDTRTERLIQAALDTLLAGRTSFVIAHRLSTIRNADQVLVLDEGQIVERGRHEELLAQRGFYYDLYMSQFRRQETEVLGEIAVPLGGDGFQRGALAPAA